MVPRRLFLLNQASGGYEGKLSELFLAVLYTAVVHNDTHSHEQYLKLSAGFRFSF